MSAIPNVLFKFANSFDVKDWSELESTLMDIIECDYQDLRKTTGICTKQEYVNSRKEALNHLKTHHLFSNLEIKHEEQHACCRLSAVIYRIDSNGKSFDSHVIYNFELTKLPNNEWKIQKIKQSVLWNEGEPSIHQGIT